MSCNPDEIEMLLSRMIENKESAAMSSNKSGLPARARERFRVMRRKIKGLNQRRYDLL